MDESKLNSMKRVSGENYNLGNEDEASNSQNGGKR
jgi:hypothetical protein